MKKYLIALVLAGILCLTAFGAFAEPEPTTGEPAIVITENTFVFQLTQMEKHPEEYVGKTVQLEGLFGTFHDGAGVGGTDEYKVFRYYPGDCCAAYDIGLEVRWPTETKEPYPSDGAWVRAEGVLADYKIGDTTYLYVTLSSLETIDQPGETFVTE
jgi:uncharacterized membrane protein YcgQ (UPF0703/DUF1980 family)